MLRVDTFEHFVVAQSNSGLFKYLNFKYPFVTACKLVLIPNSCTQCLQGFVYTFVLHFLFLFHMPTFF